LLAQLGRAGQVEAHVDVRVPAFEDLLQLPERLGERGRGEHVERRPLGTTRRTRPRGQQHPAGHHGRHDAQHARARTPRPAYRPCPPGHRVPPGVSTITCVAFTTATASAPGRSPSSSTASELISETTLCGPHCTSTCAITVSATTFVTSPTNRLRAERPTAVGSADSAVRSSSDDFTACLRANAASSAPSTTLRPAESSPASRWPERTHRRIVSSLTPIKRAASENRNCGMDRTLSPHLRKHHGRVPIRCARDLTHRRSPALGWSAMAAEQVGPTMTPTDSASSRAVNLGTPTVPGARSAAASQPRPDNPALIDTFGRVATDLRVSLTDRCNLRCSYCMPAEGLEWMPGDEVLSDDELVRLMDIAVRMLGVTDIRLTGGEPLLRPRLEDLVARITALEPRPRLSMTTNGIGFAKRAQAFADAGLDRINVSLDSVDRETFERITRRDRLPHVLDALAAARAAGLDPVKINAVLIRDLNDHQATDLLRFALEGGYHLRFIEQMPLDAQHGWDRANMITADEILELLSAEFTL